MTLDELNRLEKQVSAYMTTFAAGAEDPEPYILKLDHTLRVCGHIRMLARSLELASDARNRAVAAALVHDLGRFPQFRDFGTFSDPLSRNHAALGVREICRGKFLERGERQERAIILKAVALHNRARLPGGLSPDLDTLVRLLRDADKLDIFKVMADLYAGPENGSISFITHRHRDDGCIRPDLAAQVAGGHPIYYSQVNSLNDLKLFQLSMIYDLNYPAALAHVLDQGVVPSIVRSMPEDTTLFALEKAVIQYMEDHIRPLKRLPREGQPFLDQCR